ncbi:MAG: recombinase family protein [Terriglobales bacterium]
MNNKLRVRIYARVSTDDKGQDPLNQLLQLREFASKQPGWNLQKEYVDQLSGKNGKRPQFQQMMKDAAAHHFDVLLFWSLDRFTREGVLQTHLYLAQLTQAGVRFVSFTEQYVNSLGPFGDAIIGLLAAIAQQEHTRISERVKAGMDRARAKGARFGRPVVVVNMKAVSKLQREGLGQRGIARRLGVAVNTLRKSLGRKS